MTEDALVAAIRALCEAGGAGPAPRELELGIGDDAAVWQPSRSHLSVITTDAMVDGVHFLAARSTAESIGHRVMAANLSDVAAMGARPVLATVALGLPPGTAEAWVLDCYRGMVALAARHGARIAGGDVVRAPALTLGVTVVGEVSRPRLKRRGGGRPGDVLASTGPLGASRAGLELLRRDEPLAVGEAVRAAALATFERPRPLLAEGRFLGASARVRAMMDCSDGLSTDVGRLARASGCGARLDALPVAPEALAVAAAAGDDAARYALDGGEDFTLLVAVEKNGFAHLALRFAARFGRPLLRLGALDDGPGVRIALGDEPERALEPAGFDHLA